MSYHPIIQFRAAVALAIVVITVAGCNDTEVSLPKSVVETLSRGDDIDARDTVSGTLLGNAAENNDVPLVETLLHHGADVDVRDIKSNGHLVDVTPLHSAAFHGYIDVAKVLIRHGADVNALNSSKNTALYYAASEGDVEMVQLLLDAGSDPNSALHRAAKDRRVNVARLLIRHGANVNAMDSGGDTPLHWAAIVGSFGMVKLLLNSGADPTIRGEKRGKTALELAVDWKKTWLIKLLSKHRSVAQPGKRTAQTADRP